MTVTGPEPQAPLPPTNSVPAAPGVSTAEILNAISDLDGTLRNVINSAVEAVSSRVGVLEHAAATKPSAATTAPPKAPVTAALGYVKHPGTSTAGGLALAALSAFTATLPVSLRGTGIWSGLATAVASMLIDTLQQRSAGG